MHMPMTNMGMNWNAWAEQWREYTRGGEKPLPEYWQLDSSPALEKILAEFDQLVASGDKEKLKERRRTTEAAIEEVKSKLDELRPMHTDDQQTIELIDAGKYRLNGALADISNAVDF